MAPLSFLAAAAALAIAFVAYGTRAAARVRSPADYAVAGRSAGAAGVGGVLLGALVGGASTIGTAELAYSHGLSACWFTVGGGLGCLLLGLAFARPLRRSGVETLPQLLGERFGPPVRLAATLATALGTFLSIVAQFLAGIALLQAAAPLGAGAASLVLGLLVLGFAGLGGLRSYAALGAAKIALLYAVLLAAGVAALRAGGTPAHLWEALPRSAFDPFSLGSADLGAVASMIVGVLCTQIYAQAILSAADERTARAGALLSAGLMPPLGLLGIWVGLTLRAGGVELRPAEALPYFLRASFPAPVAGALWGAVLLTVVGTAAGLLLGVAVNLSRDLAPASPGSVWRSRAIFLALACAAAALGTLGRDAPILRWSYLSMGLRGAGTFFPLVLALLRPSALPARWALAASLAGLGATLLWPLGPWGGEPLFAGLLASGALAAMGVWSGRLSASPTLR